MTALARRLIRQISASGPLSVADYMNACLLHPKHGYYTTRDPFGPKGDFVTAPEISQMFGELIGLALAQAWIDRGAPKDAMLVELGPGRGTLMRDALRAMERATGAKLAPWLIEASPVLRDVQAKTLHPYQVNWANSLDDLPSGTIFVMANEFFDALPVRQFLREGPAWRERLIGVSDGALSFGLGAPTTLALLDPYLAHTQDGDLVQSCAPANGLMTQLAERITTQGGAALVIDYGDDIARGDTLQAVQNHQKCDPLAAPGEADLTAHVDFSALAAAAQSTGAIVSQLVPQGTFLDRLGISVRVEQLAKNRTPAQRISLAHQHRRLTHGSEMGTLFKVLGVTASGDTLLPGTVARL